MAIVAQGGEAGGAGAGEEVEDAVVGVRVDSDDAFEDAERLLGGVAGFLFAGRGDDGVPPNIGGSFATSGFFGADKGGGPYRGCGRWPRG